MCSGEAASNVYTILDKNGILEAKKAQFDILRAFEICFWHLGKTIKKA